MLFPRNSQINKPCVNVYQLFFKHQQFSFSWTVAWECILVLRLYADSVHSGTEFDKFEGTFYILYRVLNVNDRVFKMCIWRNREWEHWWFNVLFSLLLNSAPSVSSDTLRCRVLVVKRCSLKFINEYNFNFAVPSHSEDVNECIKFHLHNLSSLNSIRR